MAKCPRESEGIFIGIHSRWDARAAYDVCIHAGRFDSVRSCVIEAFVGKLDVGALGFVRAEPATGRPDHDPRDLLKLGLNGYLQQIPFLAAAGSRVPAERGSDLAGVRCGFRLQVDCRVSGGCPGVSDGGGSRIGGLRACGKPRLRRAGGDQWFEVPRRQQ